MRITPEQVDQYQRAGFLVIPDFVSHAACDELRRKAEQLVFEFDPRGLRSVFSTKEQSRLSDDYFLTSADKIRFFFEEDAFRPDGTLKERKERSIIHVIGGKAHYPPENWLRRSSEMPLRGFE